MQMLMPLDVAEDVATTLNAGEAREDEERRWRYEAREVMQGLARIAIYDEEGVEVAALWR